MYNITHFSDLLCDWHLLTNRYLPWKEDDDPFYIWLSEIILQQTRVEQGIPYFIKFRERFSNVAELAAISDKELMKLWEGLGYYSRARNLHKAAKQIVKNGGIFPNTYEKLLELPGVGPYTAAAIASFAFHLPIPVIDGNVNRAISRIFGISAAIDSSEGKKQIAHTINFIFDQTKPAAFNQAIMDFGATQCIPKSPNCGVCPFQHKCFAYLHDKVALLPYKSKKIIKKKRLLNYIIVNSDNKVLITKRENNDIWKHLYEFILIEDKNISQKNIVNSINALCTTQSLVLLHKSISYTHILTHQKLTVIFYHYHARKLNLKKDSKYFLVDKKSISDFAFPKIIHSYLKENLIYLKEN